MKENNTSFPFGLRNPYRNLKSENSQDYAQKPQRNCPETSKKLPRNLKEIAQKPERNRPETSKKLDVHEFSFMEKIGWHQHRLRYNTEVAYF
jgi:hypothetical protein